MNIMILILLSSLWGILIVEDLQFNMKKRIWSNYWFLDYLLFLAFKLSNCPLCLSAHIFWITYLILYHSLFGFVLCPIVYFATFLIKKYIINNSIS